MTDTVAAPAAPGALEASDAPSFPQDRSCPYHPPAGYERLREGGPLQRVTLYNGRQVWLVTRHEVARRLLADPRMSSDRTNENFPMLSPASRRSADSTSARGSSAWTRPSTAATAAC